MVSYKRLGIGLTVLVLTTVGVAGCATQGSRQPVGGTTPSSNRVATNVTNSVISNSTNNTPTTVTATSQNTASTENSSVNTATSASQSNFPASQFPNVINMAMKHFPSKVLNSPESPTVLPTSSSGSNQLFYRTWDTTTGPILNYSVQYSSPHNRLATFSGSTYTGMSADGAVRLNLNLPQDGHISESSVHLTSGIVAKEVTFVAPAHSAMEVSSASLSWSEGRWQILVVNSQTTQVPTNQANEVAAYLHTYFMPVPNSKGTILVTSYPGENVNGEPTGQSTGEYVTWQEGQHVYEVDTYSHAKNPIQTGLSMAISMRPYMQ
jgi:hypothetical protein